MPYADNDLTFYLVVYKDFERCCWCLTNLRKHYPTARVVVDVDGDTDPRWLTLQEHFQVEVYVGGRLFLLECGGALVRRALLHHAEDPQKRRWFFRIDTDTEIRRRFHDIPDADYFGTVRNGWKNFVQGGCIGLSRAVCVRLLAVGCFERSELQTPLTWQGKPPMAKERVAMGLVSFDWLVNWGMEQLKVKATNFGEVCSVWRSDIPPGDWAIAHPCKKIPTDRLI